MSEPDPATSIFAALQDWAKQALPAPPSGHGGPECQWCPLCQLASVLRGEHPEITERMAEAGAAISTAVRLLIDSATPGAAGDAAHPPSKDRPRPRPRAERGVPDDETPHNDPAKG
ncbi:hypothetical protein [uncultured Jatrophihabitans sp.]|uniref:hypothetical protein n=1 Tax=uncultured Jatrophihabitans sp. TaxID=1610747 RepID=UPI0035CA8A3A